MLPYTARLRWDGDGRGRRAPTGYGARTLRDEGLSSPFRRNTRYPRPAPRLRRRVVPPGRASGNSLPGDRDIPISAHGVSRYRTRFPVLRTDRASRGRALLPVRQAQPALLDWPRRGNRSTLVSTWSGPGPAHGGQRRRDLDGSGTIPAAPGLTSAASGSHPLRPSPGTARRVPSLARRAVPLARAAGWVTRRAQARSETKPSGLYRAPTGPSGFTSLARAGRAKTCRSSCSLRRSSGARGRADDLLSRHDKSRPHRSTASDTLADGYRFAAASVLGDNGLPPFSRDVAPSRLSPRRRIRYDLT